MCPTGIPQIAGMFAAFAASCSTWSTVREPPRAGSSFSPVLVKLPKARPAHCCGARGWPVDAADAGANRDGAVERGDVRVADDGFGIAFERGVVDGVEQAHGAVAAAQAPDGVDAIVAQRVVEISEPAFVVAREIIFAFVRVAADDRFPAERARVGRRALQIRRNAEWAGGSDERDARAGLEFFDYE